MHWKDGVSSALWHMIVNYTVYLYNHLPNKKFINPDDLFTGVTSSRHKIQYYRIWGAPVYVLDPKLQSRQKSSRWKPRSHRGMFVGFSSVH